MNTISEADLSKVRTILNRTLDTMLYDMLEAGGERRKRIPQAEVVEVVLDADYAEMYGPQTPDFKDALKRFRQLEYKKQIKFCKTIFDCKFYTA